MRLNFPLLLLLFSLLAFKGNNDIYLTRKGTVVLYAKPPIDLMNVSSEELKGVLNPTKKTFHFSVPVRSFDGFSNDEQQDDFNLYFLESHLFPEAELSGEILSDFNFKKDGTYPINASGVLTIHGVEREQAFDGVVHILKNVVFIETAFEVPLQPHQIPVPESIGQSNATITLEIKAEFERK